MLVLQAWRIGSNLQPEIRNLRSKQVVDLRRTSARESEQRVRHVLRSVPLTERGRSTNKHSVAVSSSPSSFTSPPIYHKHPPLYQIVSEPTRNITCPHPTQIPTRTPLQMQTRHRPRTQTPHDQMETTKSQRETSSQRLAMRSRRRRENRSLETGLLSFCCRIWDS